MHRDRCQDLDNDLMRRLKIRKTTNKRLVAGISFFLIIMPSRKGLGSFIKTNVIIRRITTQKRQRADTNNDTRYSPANFGHLAHYSGR